MKSLLLLSTLVFGLSSFANPNQQQEVELSLAGQTIKLIAEEGIDVLDLTSEVLEQVLESPECLLGSNPVRAPFCLAEIGGEILAIGVSHSESLINRPTMFVQKVSSQTARAASAILKVTASELLSSGVVSRIAGRGILVGAIAIDFADGIKRETLDFSMATVHFVSVAGQTIIRQSVRLPEALVKRILSQFTNNTTRSEVPYMTDSPYASGDGSGL